MRTRASGPPPSHRVVAASRGNPMRAKERCCAGGLRVTDRPRLGMTKEYLVPRARGSLGNRAGVGNFAAGRRQAFKCALFRGAGFARLLFLHPSHFRVAASALVSRPPLHGSHSLSHSPTPPRRSLSFLSPHTPQVPRLSALPGTRIPFRGAIRANPTRECERGWAVAVAPAGGVCPSERDGASHAFGPSLLTRGRDGPPPRITAPPNCL